MFAGVVLQPACQVAPRGEAPQPEASGRQQQRRAAAAGVGRVRGGVQHGLARHARPRPHPGPRPRRLQAALQHRDLQLHVSLHTPAQLHGGCLQVDTRSTRTQFDFKATYCILSILFLAFSNLMRSKVESPDDQSILWPNIEVVPLLTRSHYSSMNSMAGMGREGGAGVAAASSYYSMFHHDSLSSLSSYGRSCGVASQAASSHMGTYGSSLTSSASSSASGTSGTHTTSPIY